MTVIAFPDPVERLFRRLNIGPAEEAALMAYSEKRGERVRFLMKFEKEVLRHFWDGVGDDSFYNGPEGSFDCADIWSAMTQKGDGDYCAV